MSPFTKEALEAQAQHWKEEAEKQRRARYLQGIIGLVALGALISFTIWYVADNQRKSDQIWCELITGLDDRYRAVQSPTPEAADFAIKIHKIRVGLECPATDPPKPDPRPSRSRR